MYVCLAPSCVCNAWLFLICLVSQIPCLCDFTSQIYTCDQCAWLYCVFISMLLSLYSSVMLSGFIYIYIYKHTLIPDLSRWIPVSTTFYAHIYIIFEWGSLFGFNFKFCLCLFLCYVNLASKYLMFMHTYKHVIHCSNKLLFAHMHHETTCCLSWYHTVISVLEIMNTNQIMHPASLWCICSMHVYPY